MTDPPDSPDPNRAWGQLGGYLKQGGSPRAVLATAVFLKEWVEEGGALPDAWKESRESFLECVEMAIEAATGRMN